MRWWLRNLTEKLHCWGKYFPACIYSWKLQLTCSCKNHLACKTRTFKWEFVFIYYLAIRNRIIKASASEERAHGRKKNRDKKGGGYCECCAIKYESLSRVGFLFFAFLKAVFFLHDVYMSFKYSYLRLRLILLVLLLLLLSLRIIPGSYNVYFILNIDYMVGGQLTLLMLKWTFTVSCFFF